MSSSEPEATTAQSAVVASSSTPQSDESGNPQKRATITREDSMEELLPQRGSEELTMADYERHKAASEATDVASLNLPPGRMHATRVPERLSGSSGNISTNPGELLQLHIPPNLTKGGVTSSPGGGGKGSPYSPRSRSRSPSLKDKQGAGGVGGGATGLGGVTAATATTMDANSSISSLDEIVDQDILYDRAGFVELDSQEVHKKLHNSREFSKNLSSVNERLSEDTLEDVHAFSDLNVHSSNASRASNTPAGELLEPLNECDETDDLDEITEEGDNFNNNGGNSDDLLHDGNGGHGTDNQPQHQVIVTNLDNLTLNDPGSAASGQGGDNTATGSSCAARGPCTGDGGDSSCAAVQPR